MKPNNDEYKRPWDIDECIGLCVFGIPGAYCFYCIGLCIFEIINTITK